MRRAHDLRSRLTAAAFSVLGVQAWSARLVPMLAAWLTVLVTWCWGRHLLGPGAAFLAGLILVLSPGPGHVVQILANPAVGERETERALGVQRAVQAVLA